MIDRGGFIERSLLDHWALCVFLISIFGLGYYITVSIVTLCVIWGLNAWIGTKEPAYPWVINVSIHMNKETVEFK